MHKSFFLIGTLFLLLTSHAQAQTVATPIQIKTCQDLQNMQNNLSGNYVLANNVDCTGVAFNPIGSLLQVFSGNFDGQGYAVKGLTLNFSNSNFTGQGIGLFGAISGSNIKNVIIDQAYVRGADCCTFTSALVGTAFGVASNIQNVLVTGADISGGVAVGGLVGNGQTLINIINSSAQNVKVHGPAAGGLAGSNVSEIIQSYSTGNVTGASAGGLEGILARGDTITNSYSLAHVSSYPFLGMQAAGGMVGTIYNYGSTTSPSVITNSFAAGIVDHTLNNGGISGSGAASFSTGTYWDIQATGQSNDPNPASIGKTTAQMYQQSTFVGWDFNKTWSIIKGTDYPHLQWEHGPINIKNCQQLQAINNDLQGNYILANDIDCSATQDWNNGLGFIPIGSSNAQGFTGTLDGANHKITGLNINLSSLALDAKYSITASIPGGIFSTISSATIENVAIENAFIKSGIGNALSILAGQSQNNSILKNDHVSGSLGGSNFSNTGGITALINNSSISQSSSNIRVNALKNSSTTAWGIGGLAGYSIGSTIGQSYAQGSIKTNGIEAGGLIAKADAGTIINDSYSKVQINFACEAPPYADIGVGGIIGTTNISAIAPQGSVNISNAYAIGAMTAIAPKGASYSCVPAGGISGGLLYSAPATVTNSYWDTQSTGTSNTFFSRGTGETTAQMYNQASYVGWDFVNTWSMDEGVAFPHLQWEPVNLTITKSTDGQGIITSNPVGVNCQLTSTNSQCQAEFTQGANIVLLPVANTGSIFKGLVPVKGLSLIRCRMSPLPIQCTMTLNQNTVVNAQFDLVANANVVVTLIDSVTNKPITVYGEAILNGQNRTEMDKIVNGQVSLVDLKSQSYMLTILTNGYRPFNQVLIINPSDQGNTKYIMIKLHR